MHTSSVLDLALSQINPLRTLTCYSFTFLGLSCGLIPAPSDYWPVWVISTQIQFTSKLSGVCQQMTYRAKVH